MLGNRLKLLREQHSMTQKELSELLGFKTYTTITKWESGDNLPRGKELKILAEFFNVSSDYLLGLSSSVSNDNIIGIYEQLDIDRQQLVLRFSKQQLNEQNNIIDFVSEKELFEQTASEIKEDVSVYGFVSAGTGLEILNEVIDVVQYPRPVPMHDLALIVRGDSMSPLFQDDDIVFVKKTNIINHGQIGIFILNGKAYIKKLYKTDNSVKLVSLNKKYDDIELTEYDSVEIVGTVVL